MRIPDNICLGTLRPTRGQPYSAAAVSALWGGKRIAPVLSFEQKVFAEFRRDAAPRISISGVQDKISLRIVNGGLAPTDRNGEFILKPIPRALSGTLDLLDDVPANEHVTMQIAAQVFKLRSAACGLVFFPDGEPAYIVRRFDRDSANGRKLAQEDFCQLAGKSRATHGENYKYDGSYEELGRLLRQYSPAWRVEAERLFTLIVFNYVCGNGDAHLKTPRCSKHLLEITRSALLTTCSVRRCTSRPRGAQPWTFLMISSLQVSMPMPFPNVRISWNWPTGSDYASLAWWPYSTDSLSRARRWKHFWTGRFFRPRVMHATAPS